MKYLLILLIPLTAFSATIDNRQNQINKRSYSDKLTTQLFHHNELLDVLPEFILNTQSTLFIHSPNILSSPVIAAIDKLCASKPHCEIYLLLHGPEVLSQENSSPALNLDVNIYFIRQVENDEAYNVASSFIIRDKTDFVILSDPMALCYTEIPSNAGMYHLYASDYSEASVVHQQMQLLLREADLINPLLSRKDDPNGDHIYKRKLIKKFSD